MASVTITIPDPVVTRVLTAICANHGYQATIDGSPNPETKAQAVKRYVKEWAMAHVEAYEAKEAAEEARLAAIAAAKNDITIT